MILKHIFLQGHPHVIFIKSLDDKVIIGSETNGDPGPNSKSTLLDFGWRHINKQVHG
jgi:hypothetical protein